MHRLTFDPGQRWVLLLVLHNDKASAIIIQPVLQPSGQTWCFYFQNDCIFRVIEKPDNVIKLFTPQPNDLRLFNTNVCNKLERFPFQPCLMFYVFNLGVFVISQCVCPWHSFPAQNNILSLLLTNVCNKLECFPFQPSRMFYVCNLRMFVIRKSVCPWHSFSAQSNVQTCNLRMFVKSQSFCYFPSFPSLSNVCG